VLANGSDPRGLTLTAVLDQDHDVQHGILSRQSDGLFSYTHSPGFSGTDSFTYEAVDSSGCTSDPATVTITVTADAPGGTLAGGVGFHGPGQTASAGFGATGGGSDTPDNFAPSFRGPELTAPAAQPGARLPEGARRAPAHTRLEARPEAPRRTAS